MTNAVITTDANAVALRENTDRSWKRRVEELKAIKDIDGKLGPTIVLSRRQGGTGASTLALELDYIFTLDALIIEIGGNRCAAFKGRSPDHHRHFSSYNEDYINQALDLRLAHASRVTILEFEPTLFRQSLDIASKLTSRFPGSWVSLFYLAGRYEVEPKFPAKAAEMGFAKVLQCCLLQPGQQYAENGVIRLPWFDHRIMSAIHYEQKSIEEAMDCVGIWSREEARYELERFGANVRGRQ